MIALLNHDVRFSPTCEGLVYSTQKAQRPPLPHPPSRGHPSTAATIDTCQGFHDDGCLDSTELSAAQALLNLTPTCYVHPASNTTTTYRGYVREAPYYTKNTPVGRMIHNMAPAVVVTSDCLTSDESSDEESSYYYYPTESRHRPPCSHDGTISLALDTDEDFLSPLHCFMRRYCVEAFTATREDASEPRYGGSHHHHGGGSRVVPGQVGIRCLHCKHRAPSERAERAVCFPSSLKNIYHSIETWQRRHSLVCQDIPAWVKREMTDLIKGSKTCAGGRRGYWEESAARIGLTDTGAGIRFVRRPGDITDRVPDDRAVILAPADDARRRRPVVEPGDRALVTDYLFLLLDQMETCSFTEEDRAGGRSKVKSCPVGFPGMECKHCAGKAGFGRYFPASLSALTSANSDRNIYNHVQKCRRCPLSVKQNLVQLRGEYQRHKNRRGSRKVFFQRVWERLQS